MRCQAQSFTLSFVFLFCLSGLVSARALALPRAQEIVPGTELLPGSGILAPNRALTPLEEVMLGNPELITPARAAGTIFEGFEDPNREEQENLF